MAKSAPPRTGRHTGYRGQGDQGHGQYFHIVDCLHILYLWVCTVWAHATKRIQLTHTHMHVCDRPAHGGEKKTAAANRRHVHGQTVAA